MEQGFGNNPIPPPSYASDEIALFFGIMVNLPKTIADCPLRNRPALLREVFRRVQQATLAARRAKFSHPAEAGWNIREELPMYGDSGKAFGR
jgi:hypothetical protein